MRNARRSTEAHSNDADDLLPRHSPLDVFATERAADPPRVQPERLRKKHQVCACVAEVLVKPGPVAAGQHKIVAHAFGKEQLERTGQRRLVAHLQRNRQPKALVVCANAVVKLRDQLRRKRLGRELPHGVTLLHSLFHVRDAGRNSAHDDVHGGIRSIHGVARSDVRTHSEILSRASIKQYRERAHCTTELTPRKKGGAGTFSAFRATDCEFSELAGDRKGACWSISLAECDERCVCRAKRKPPHAAPRSTFGKLAT